MNKKQEHAKILLTGEKNCRNCDNVAIVENTSTATFRCMIRISNSYFNGVDHRVCANWKYYTGDVGWLPSPEEFFGRKNG